MTSEISGVTGGGAAQCPLAAFTGLAKQAYRAGGDRRRQKKKEKRDKKKEKREKKKEKRKKKGN